MLNPGKSSKSQHELLSQEDNGCVGLYKWQDPKKTGMRDAYSKACSKTGAS